MTDNIFDRLAELLQSSGPVNWRLAAQIAESVAGPADPVEPWVAEEHQELGRTAAMLVERAGTLDTAAVPAVTVTDARGWAAANIEGYAYLAEPLAAKLSGGGPAMPGMGLEALFTQLGPAMVGMQVGSLTGAIARTTMGQFDAALPPIGTGSFVVVPAVESLAEAEGLDVRQVRLWAAIRETAHQALMAVPWLADHLAALTAAYLDELDMSPDLLQERLQGLQDPAEMERLLSEPGGLTGFTPGPGAEAARSDLTALVALIEGYGRAAAAEAAGDLIPDPPGIEAVAGLRRGEAGPEQALEQMAGIVVDRDLASDAEDFSVEIVRRWGPDARERLWAGPDGLPTEAEIGDPIGWAARVLLPDDLDL
ncbi:MAG: zinc-dependent metalloprotease [Actinobacteria bacterium]|nr:zinc-dependent metalloprotease [Actinomycetota bacterium]